MNQSEIQFLLDIAKALESAKAGDCTDTNKTEDYEVKDGVIFINNNPKKKGTNNETIRI
jgi:hypothetical protein